MTEKTTNDLYLLLESIHKQQSAIVLDADEVATLKEMIADRKAAGRVWSWGKYVLGSLATIIVSWQVITGEFFKWLKQGIN